MEFEFDPEKDARNRDKHGIGFEEAGALWRDPRFLIVAARVEDEPRWMGIGRLRERVWSAIFTVRHGRIRLISVRRSRDEEVRSYEEF